MRTKLKLLVPNAIIASAGLVLASGSGYGPRPHFGNPAIVAHANAPAKSQASGHRKNETTLTDSGFAHLVAKR